MLKDAVNLQHWFQFGYLEGTTSKRGGNVRSTFYVESDFGVSFIIKSQEIGFFLNKGCLFEI